VCRATLSRIASKFAAGTTTGTVQPGPTKNRCPSVLRDHIGDLARDFLRRPDDERELRGGQFPGSSSAESSTKTMCGRTLSIGDRF
jgi:hypothetical protein